MNVFFLLFFYCGFIERFFVDGNICSYTENAESVCCEGWVKNVYGDCIKSECFYDCGYGKCVGLNVCECLDGSTRSDACPSPEKKSCPKDCSNRGKCRDWKCICNPGYAGIDCSITLTSTCYVKVNRGLCKSTPDGLQLTREECCSIFQMAWGIPCQFCNERNSCGKGFIMKNGVCEDIDECRLSGICLHGQCINERGSFRCQCPPRNELNENTMACQPLKEICETSAFNCGSYGRCVSLITGDYKCICKEPYESSEDGKTCKRRRIYNVCKIFDKLCQPHGECQPIGMSYTCKCQYGYLQSHDKKSCRINLQSNTNNEDLCRNPEVSRKCFNGHCISNGDTYKCVCYNPYKASFDFQECILNQITTSMVSRYCTRKEYYVQCQGGQCIDAYNGYYCNCLEGFTASDNGRRCTRNDKENNGRNPELSKIYCSIKAYSSRCNGGQCIGDETYGFKCLCLQGFIAASDGRACHAVKRDPCKDMGNKCYPGSCQPVGNDDFQCDCPSSLTKSKDSRRCYNNEISTRPPSKYCDIPSYRERCAGGHCIPDNQNGFKCVCIEGFKASEDGRACHKITRHDPCSDNRDKCYPGSCLSVGINDFQCDCPSSLTKSEDGRRCYNNEISTRPPSTYCDIPSYRERCAAGQCIPDNRYGFKCVCFEGFKASEDGRACHKINLQDPCSNNEYKCKPGLCKSVGEFDFQCECPAYMERSDDGRRCLSKVSESICQKHQSSCKEGTCIERSKVDYECQCGQGYIKSNDGRSCQRKVESICDIYGSRCLTGLCYARGPQDYMCLCSSGYTPVDDSKACEKVIIQSFCLKYQSNCLGGKCIEFNNNDYKCECLPGYHKSGDSRSCIKDLKSMCDRYSSRCLNGVCYSLGDDDYFCICAMGYISVENNKACVKKSQNSLCMTFGSRCKGNTCIENGNDYKCICSSGYVISGDQKSCEKIEMNEKCAQVQNRCRDGFCFDIIPGYICVCSSNYFASEDGKYCNENDKIMLKTNNIDDNALIEYTYSKSCNTSRNRQCHPGNCINQNTSYSCTCPHSFILGDDGKTCKRDSTQCPHCYYGCQNKESNSKCLCSLDYKDLLNTGLCIKYQKYLKYSLSEFQCNSEIKINRTFIITFTGKLSEGIPMLKSVHKDIAGLIEPRQSRGVQLNFCVPTRKHQYSLKEVERVKSWRVICIFDC